MLVIALAETYSHLIKLGGSLGKVSQKFKETG
jgi:hypothetical protein